MDLAHNEEVLKQILQFTPVEVTTKNPIDASILMSKRIQRITYEADSFDEDFVALLKKCGLEATLVCTDAKNLDKERTKFFDYLIHQNRKPQVIKNNMKILEGIDLNSLKIKSRKKIICGNNIYESHYDRNERKNVDDLFVDLDWLMIYNTVDE
jgi:hypothetical protein